MLVVHPGPRLVPRRHVPDMDWEEQGRKLMHVYPATHGPHNPNLGHAVGMGASWGMFWGLLFGLLFFIPVFGMAVGAGLGALMGKVEKSGLDKEFINQVREMLQPGTSALFMVIEKVTPDKAIEAMSQFGGTVLKSSLSKDAEHELQEALHGSSVPA